MDDKNEEEGYGDCSDCIWYKDPGGCNVKRDSPACLLNRGPREVNDEKDSDIINNTD
jgi:hypothetical protein